MTTLAFSPEVRSVPSRKVSLNRAPGPGAKLVPEMHRHPGACGDGIAPADDLCLAFDLVDHADAVRIVGSERRERRSNDDESKKAGK
jgi:hypothetical protein